MQIREYVESRDRKGLHRCVVALQEFERDLDARMPPGEEIADALVERMFDDCREHRGTVLVAEDAGQVVGYACVLARKRSEDIDEGVPEYGLVSDLAVLASHRKRGLGRALLIEAERRALQSGARWLRVSVLARNPTARALYAARGFEEYEIILEKAVTDPGSA